MPGLNRELGDLRPVVVDLENPSTSRILGGAHLYAGGVGAVRILIALIATRPIEH